MTCAELDILLCDYVDGTLDAAQRARVEGHLAECVSCRELAIDGSGAVAFMERAAVVEPPPELMTRILFDVRAGKPQASKKPSWMRRVLGPVFEAILQPRFVMGMAMTILSFSMMERFAGVPVRYLKASDLEPRKVWVAVEHKVNRGWLAVVRYYDSLRFVYEVQSRLREWSEQDEQAAGTQAGSGNTAQPRKEDGSPSGSPAIMDSNDPRLREYRQPAEGSGAPPADNATERPRK